MKKTCGRLFAKGKKKALTVAVRVSCRAVKIDFNSVVIYPISVEDILPHRDAAELR